jgi:hypothetical protein
VTDPFTKQLELDAHVEDLRDRSRRVRTIPSDAAGSGRGCVVLADREWAGEMDAVELRLARWDVPVLRLDPETLPERGVTLDPTSRRLTIDDTAIEVTVFWQRDFRASSVLPLVSGPTTASIAADGWQATVSQLAAIANVVVNRSDPGPLAQLRAATECGFSVPRTLVSNRLMAAAAQFASERVVVKSAANHWIETTPGVLRGAFATVARKEELTEDSLCPAGPLVVQEFVEHVAELRVYVAGAAHAAFRVHKPSPASMWKDPDAVTVEATRLSAATVNALHALQRSLDLDYGAYDLLVTEDRGIVFLEVNPTGSWLWLEQKLQEARPVGRHLPFWLRLLTGPRPVTAAVTTTIRDLHRAALEDETRPPNHSRRSRRWTRASTAAEYSSPPSAAHPVDSGALVRSERP